MADGFTKTLGSQHLLTFRRNLNLGKLGLRGSVRDVS